MSEDRRKELKRKFNISRIIAVLMIVATVKLCMIYADKVEQIVKERAIPRVSVSL